MNLNKIFRVNTKYKINGEKYFKDLVCHLIEIQILYHAIILLENVMYLEVVLMNNVMYWQK